MLYITRLQCNVIIWTTFVGFVSSWRHYWSSAPRARWHSARKKKIRTRTSGCPVWGFVFAVADFTAAHTHASFMGHKSVWKAAADIISYNVYLPIAPTMTIVVIMLYKWGMISARRSSNVLRKRYTNTHTHNVLYTKYNVNNIILLR